MSKFCTQCGSSLDDLAQVCPNCGNAIEAAPVEAAPAEEAPATTPQLNVKLIAIAAAVLVVVIVLSCFIFPALSNSPEDAIDNMIAVMEGKDGKVDDLLPDSIWEYVEDENDDFDMDDFAEYFAEQTLEGLEDMYGDGINISYDVEKKTALKDKKLEEIAESLSDRYDIDEDDVKEGYKMKVTMSIEGDEDDDEDESEMTVIKIGSKWYVYEMMSGVVNSAKYFS